MSDKEWFLLKHNDKQVRGPVRLDQLKAWAVSAKIGPMDRVSNDAKASWSRAPMIPQLQMDWLVELDDNYLYGPTSIATIQEFIASGEIKDSDNIINCLDNQRMTVAECPAFSNFVAREKNKITSQAQEQPAPPQQPASAATDAAGSLEERLSLLEEVVAEQRAELQALKKGHQQLIEMLPEMLRKNIPPDTVSYLI